MAGESWAVAGQQKNPIWITGSAFGGGGGAILTEESFTAATSSNALSEYETPFTVGLGYESASVVKASAGQLYEILISNPSAVPVFFQTFNRTTSPPNGTIPKTSLRIEASSSFSVDYRAGKMFSTGIVLGLSNNYSTFTGSASGSFNAFYK